MEIGVNFSTTDVELDVDIFGGKPNQMEVPHSFSLLGTKGLRKNREKPK